MYMRRTSIVLNDEHMFNKDNISADDMETKFYNVEGEIGIKSLDINLNSDLLFDKQTIKNITIHVRQNTKVKFRKATFEKCTINLDNSNVSFENCKFISNRIRLENISSITTMGCIFEKGACNFSESNCYMTDTNIKSTKFSFKCGCNGSLYNVFFDECNNDFKLEDESQIFLRKCLVRYVLNGGLKLINSSIEITECEFNGMNQTKFIFDKSSKSKIDKSNFNNIEVTLTQSYCQFTECSFGIFKLIANIESKVKLAETIVTNDSFIDINKSVLKVKMSTLDNTSLRMTNSSEGLLRNVIISNLLKKIPICVEDSEIKLINSTLFRCEEGISSSKNGSILLFRCILEGKEKFLSALKNGYIEAKGCIFSFYDSNIITTNNGSLFIAGCVFRPKSEIGTSPTAYDDAKPNSKIVETKFEEINKLPSFIKINSEYWNSIKCCYIIQDTDNAELFSYEKINGELAHLLMN